MCNNCQPDGLPTIHALNDVSLTYVGSQMLTTNLNLAEFLRYMPVTTDILHILYFITNSVLNHWESYAMIMLEQLTNVKFYTLQLPESTATNRICNELIQ